MHPWALHCENPEGGRREFALDQPRYTVGRGATGDEGVAHLCLTGDSLVSRQHFEVIPAPEPNLEYRDCHMQFWEDPEDIISGKLKGTSPDGVDYDEGI